MTPAEARRIQDARRAGGLADTLEELRAMLPPGLTRWERASVMSPEVLEVWD